MELQSVYATLLAALLLYMLPGVLLENICKAPDRSRVEAALRRYSFPKGGEQAGNFTEDSMAHSLPDCVTSCCRVKDCNMAFFFKDVCFLIHCNVSNPEGCDAETRPGDESLRNVYLAQVRSIDETSTSSEALESYARPRYSSAVRAEPPLPAADAVTSTASTAAAAAAGPVAMNKSEAGAAPTHRPSLVGGRICQLNLNTDCPSLEHCVASSGRRRHGICTCIPGYTRLDPGDTCQLAQDGTPAESTAGPADITGSDTATDGGHQTADVVTRPDVGPSTVRSTTPSSAGSLLVSIVGDSIIHLPNGYVKLSANISPEAIELGILHYNWTIIQRPAATYARVADVMSSEPVLEVKGLKPGSYFVTLVVSSARGYSGTSVTNLTVLAAVRAANRAPEAVISEANRTVALPLPLLIINGSLSYDDVKIVGYKWVRNMMSPAAGDVVGSTGLEPVLLLTNIVSGLYHWSLVVTDEEGAESIAHSFITVVPDPLSFELIELEVEVPTGKFTVADKQTLTTQLGLLLYKPFVKTEIIIHQMTSDWRTGKLIVTLTVTDSPVDTNTGTSGSPSIRGAAEVVQQLRDKLRTSANVLQYSVTSVDTVECSNNCSGHGHCDPLSRECVCDLYWIPNVINAYVTGRSNCDWGIFYVLGIAMGSIFAAISLGWLCCRCYRRCCRSASQKKRNVYRLLNDLDDIDKTRQEPDTKAPKNRRTTYAAPMLTPDSEATSDDDTAEDTVFIKGGRSNHVLPSGNGRKSTTTGDIKPPSALVAENNLKNKQHA